MFATSQVPDQSGELHQITCPVLGLWGEDDQFCPISGAATLEQALPDVRVERFRNVGIGSWLSMRRSSTASFATFIGALMALAQHLIDALGDELWACLNERRTVAPITDRHPEMTIDDAYAVNLRLRNLRSARGDRLVGKKIGVTSHAVQSMLGVDQPDFGFLFDTMVYEREMPISKQPSAARRESSLLCSRRCSDRASPTKTSFATEVVIPCFEVVDSRIADWKVKIQDTVADNASCGLYILGQGVSPHGLDFPNLAMRVQNRAAQRGRGRAALDSPVKCVTWLPTPRTLRDLVGRWYGFIGVLGPPEPVKRGYHAA